MHPRAPAWLQAIEGVRLVDFQRGHGLFGPWMARVVAEAPAGVHLEGAWSSGGRWSVRARRGCAAPPGVWLRVREDRRLLRLRRDVAIGDELFDDIHRVEASDPAAARLLLDPDTVTAILDCWERDGEQPLELALGDGEVCATIEADDDDLTIPGVVTAVAALAARPAAVAADWAALADRLGGRVVGDAWPLGASAIEVIAPGAAVVLRLRGGTSLEIGGAEIREVLPVRSPDEAIAAAITRVARAAAGVAGPYR